MGSGACIVTSAQLTLPTDLLCAYSNAHRSPEILANLLQSQQFVIKFKQELDYLENQHKVILGKYKSGPNMSAQVAGMHSTMSYLCVCVHLMKIMRLNLPASFFPFHRLACMQSPGLFKAFYVSIVSVGCTSINCWRKKTVLLHRFRKNTCSCVL